MITPIDAKDTMKPTPSVLIDVRTPLEYQHAHIPNAYNIPLLSNSERIVIGTLYKQQGRKAAVLKGYEVLAPRWAQFIHEAETIAPDGNVRLYCWRGGMRSGSMAWALNNYGFQVEIIQGGYKAFRNQVLALFAQPFPLVMLSGRTGSGKTKILQELMQRGEAVIDLEALTNHQGSSFGSLGYKVQPSQEQFENDLATQLAALQHRKRIWIESESVVIGKRVIPSLFFQQMQQVPVFDLIIPEACRVESLVHEYGNLDKGFLQQALLGISKRLGPLQTKEALQALHENRMHDFIRWALQYYDKHYLKSLDRRKSGNVHSLEFTDWNLDQILNELLAASS
jgi:tRNA 2-selenouridine synthase